METAFAFAGVAAAVIPVALVVVVLLAVVGGRREADPDLERPRVLYLVSAGYVGLVVFIVGLVAVFTGVVELITEDFDFEPDKEALIADIIRTAIVAVAGLITLVLHDRAAVRMIGPVPTAGSRLWVRAQMFTAFTAFLALLVAGVVTAFGTLTVLSPDLANVTDREEGLGQFLPGAIAAAVSAAVLVITLGRARRVEPSVDPNWPFEERTESVPPPPPAPPAGSWAPNPPPGPRQGASPPVTAPPPPAVTPEPAPSVPEAFAPPDVAPPPDIAPPPAPEPEVSDVEPRPAPAPRKAAPRLRRARPLRPPEDRVDGGDSPPPPPPV